MISSSTLRIEGQRGGVLSCGWVGLRWLVWLAGLGLAGWKSERATKRLSMGLIEAYHSWVLGACCSVFLCTVHLMRLYGWDGSEGAKGCDNQLAVCEGE